MIRFATKITLNVGAFGVMALAAVTAVMAQDDAAGNNQEGGLGFTPNAAVAPAVDEGTLLQKSSYILGYKMTSQWVEGMQSQGVEFDKASIMEGVRQAVAGEEFGMTDEEVQAVMTAFQKVVEKQMMEKAANAAATNKAEGEALLAATAQKEGVKKLDNGVLYEVITEGTGASPAATDRVKIHYHGMFADGTVFDSSVERGEPYDKLAANQFVKGFSAALQAMKVGDKWKVTIPSDLAYGVQASPEIGPNRVLIFEIELLDILK
jgi:FKBP-type peptidyl-prolyl cis-trans isomerase FklB